MKKIFFPMFCINNTHYGITPKLLLFFSVLFCNQVIINAQSTNDFRTAAPGNWATLATWQRYDGSTWVAASYYPGETPTSSKPVGNITISHTVTFSGPSLTINNPNSSKQLIINSSTDSLHFTSNNSITFPAGSSIVITAGKITGDPCNANKKIVLGSTNYTSCVGNGDAISFAELTAAGGSFNTTLSSTANCTTGNLTATLSAAATYQGTPTYSWTQTSGPGTSTFTTATSQNPSVSVTAAGTYTYNLATTYTYPLPLSGSNTINRSINVTYTSSGSGVSALSYSGTPLVVCQNTAITAMNPTITGTPTSYSISPALPTGLSINTTSGVISGMPSVSSALTTYTVTATSSCNTTTANIDITVNALPIVSAGTNQTICPGSAITLNGSGASTYVWDNSVTNGVAFVPSSSLTYTVTGTDANNCSNTSAITINLHMVPNLSASSLSACSEETWGAAKDLPVPAGTSYLSVTSLAYNSTYLTKQASDIPNGPYPVDNLAAAVTRTDKWKNSDSNPHDVTYKIRAYIGGIGCFTDSVNFKVTINPLPTALISGVTSICSGSSTTLTASGGTSYNWGGGNMNAMYTVSTAGPHTVIVTDANGCTDTESATLTIKPLPTLASISSSSNSVCAGTSVSFTASGLVNGMNTFYYSVTGSATNSGSQTATVSGNSYTFPASNYPSGTYNIAINSIEVDGCTTTFTSGNTTSFTVKPSPTLSSVSPSASSVCPGTGVSFTANGLLNGSNIFNYSITGATTTTGTQTATASMNAYTFSSANYPSGTYNIAINSIEVDGCTTTFTSGNTTSFTVYPTASIKSTGGDISMAATWENGCFPIPTATADLTFNANATNPTNATLNYAGNIIIPMGVTFINNGSIILTGGKKIINNGTYAGTGSATANFENNGSVKPGN
jgi:hypothetical protein